MVPRNSILSSSKSSPNPAYQVTKQLPGKHLNFSIFDYQYNFYHNFLGRQFHHCFNHSVQMWHIPVKNIDQVPLVYISDCLVRLWGARGSESQTVHSSYKRQNEKKKSEHRDFGKNGGKLLGVFTFLLGFSVPTLSSSRKG